MRIGEARQFTEEEIKYILTSGESIKKLKKRFRCGHGAIKNVMTGKTHSNVAPYIKRQPMPLVDGASTCYNCLHWTSGKNQCDLGHVDPLEEGPLFARDCSSFKKRCHQQQPTKRRVGQSG